MCRNVVRRSIAMTDWVVGSQQLEVTLDTNRDIRPVKTVGEGPYDCLPDHAHGLGGKSRG
jgi:hypothetical protein